MTISTFVFLIVFAAAVCVVGYLHRPKVERFDEHIVFGPLTWERVRDREAKRIANKILKMADAQILKGRLSLEVKIRIPPQEVDKVTRFVAEGMVRSDWVPFINRYGQNIRRYLLVWKAKTNWESRKVEDDS